MRKLIFLVFIFWSSSVFAVPVQIVFTAYGSQNPIWKLSLLESNKECQLEGSSLEKKSKPIIKKVTGRDCIELLKVAKEAIQESKSKASSKKAKLKIVDYAIDSPSYTLKIATQTFQVKFEAPEVCETHPSGKMTCKKNFLTATQRLIIPLHGYASEMGFR